MGSAWRPDDSLHERDAKGEVRGARRVKDALRKHGVRVANRVITSQDPGMDALVGTLKRSGMPPGAEQWQLPISDSLDFIGQMAPGATVPRHAHKHAVLRVVIKGSLQFEGNTLYPGDWMIVSAGTSYSLQAGPDGCTTFYHHPGPPPPQVPKPPTPKPPTTRRSAKQAPAKTPKRAARSTASAKTSRTARTTTTRRRRR